MNLIETVVIVEQVLKCFDDYYDLQLLNFDYLMHFDVEIDFEFEIVMVIITMVVVDDWKIVMVELAAYFDWLNVLAKNVE